MNHIPQIYNGKPLTASWVYRATDGAHIGVVGRYQNGTDKKEIVPFFKKNSTGFSIGIDINPRPLFGLDKLVNHQKDKAIFVVEGEKSAAALLALGIVSVTSIGGAQSATKADWKPLNGFKTVYILPDNDKPGETYAQDVYTALMALESPPKVKVLRLPDLSEGGDVCNWLQNFAPDWDGYQSFPESEKSWVLSELRAELKKAEPVSKDWINNVNLVDSQTGVFEENPVEINTKLKPVRPFDFELLPNALKNCVADIANRMQCPPDYIGVSMMVALSAVVGKKGLAHPKRRDDWTVCPNLWGLNIGRPSAMKTPAASEALKPLQLLELKAKKDFDNALVSDEVQNFINKEGRSLAEKQAKNLIEKKKFAEAKQLLLENSEESANPTRKRFLVNDCTIEKLGELLNENPNGLILYRDEIIGFLKTIDREDRTNDRAFYLEAFNGLGSYTFDRIGRGTIEIESVCLAMLGNIQPGLLQPYLSQACSGKTGDDGMIQRFQLMVWPDLTDWRHVDQWPDKAAKDETFNVFTRLADWEGYQQPARFNEEAQNMFDEWYCDLHQQLRADDIYPAIESHFGKYKSLVPSLAVLIHLADNPNHSVTIGIESLQKAIAWTEYLKSHVERLYGSALDPVDANAKTILTKIESGKLSDGFGARNVMQGGWSGLDSMDSINRAISRLVEYGWLRQVITKPSAMGGRPSIQYQIHPKILQKRSV